MTRLTRLLHYALPVALAVGIFTAQAAAQAPAGAASQPPAEQLQQHPLIPAIEMATRCLEQIIGNIMDYSCTLGKRERELNRRHAFLI